MNQRFCVTTSWDDGSVYDLRLAKLLKKYQIPATFYIPLKNNEREVLSRPQIQTIAKDFEIGCHGITHTDLTQLTEEESEREIRVSKEKLERIVRKEIVSFCYPQGKYTDTIKQLVGKAGFDSARTTRLFATTIGDTLLLPTTVHAYNHNPLVYPYEGLDRKLFYQLAIRHKKIVDWEILAYSALDYCLSHGGIFHLWGHSWEIEASNDWAKLERVFQYIATKTNKADRLTNTEVVQRQKIKKYAFYHSLQPHSYQKTYETAYYKKEQKFIYELVKEFDKKEKKIVDIGCGTGRVSSLFQNSEYLGIDVAAQLIAYAKTKWGKKNKTFIAGSYKSVVSLKKKYDLIIIWGLFEDEPNPFGRIERLEKQLTPNGRIIFTIHNANNPIFRLAQFAKTEILEKNFPYTCFTYEFIKQWAAEYACARGLDYQIATFGIIPPINKFVPGIQSKTLGGTIVVILDKR